jgi:hypothetical protein
MSTKTWFVIVALATLVLTGCASSLKIFDSAQTPVVGVPFRAAEVYVKQGVKTKASKGGTCDPTPFIDTATLPTGTQFFANVDPAQLAKTGFTMKFADNGALTEISLNTEPSGAEMLKATNELLKTALPVLGLAAAGGAAGAAGGGGGGGAAPVSAPACDAGEANVQWIRFDEYMKSRR